jgi:hypothetical protein
VPVRPGNGDGVHRLMAEIVAETPGFQKDRGVNANVAQRLFRVRRLSEQQPIVSRAAGHPGSCHFVKKR